MSNLIDLRHYYQPIVADNLDVGLFHLTDHIQGWGLDLDPDYQRGHVWNEYQREAFMGFLLCGGVPPHCYMAPITWDRSELIDGKQRVTTVLMWLNGEVAALLPDGLRVRRDEAVPESLRGLEQRLRFGIIKGTTRAERIRIYLRLNAGGSVHTAEEIQKARDLLNEITAREGTGEEDNGIRSN